MKKPHAFPDPLADEQAALWAARLDGSTLSAADRIALDAWLAEQPSHRTLLSLYCQFSADLEQQLPLIAGIKELSAEAPEKAMTAQPSPWLRRPLMVGVALTAAAAVVVLGIWWNRPNNTQLNIATPLAQRQSLTLADGSHVEMNARTSLQVEFQAHERHVRLADGEAFFSVQKDSTRPFIVETPAGSVRVTGTKFNVRTDDSHHLEVTVIEGSVQARSINPDRSSPAPAWLTAGQKFTATPGGTTVSQLSPAGVNATLAWRQGLCTFADETLQVALSRFARYHGRGITISPEAAVLRIGGTHRLDDLDGFLATLQDIHPMMQVHRDLNGCVLVDVIKPGQRQPH